MVVLQEEVKTNALSEQMAEFWLLGTAATHITSLNTFLTDSEETPLCTPKPSCPHASCDRSLLQVAQALYVLPLSRAGTM